MSFTPLLAALITGFVACTSPDRPYGVEASGAGGSGGIAGQGGSGQGGSGGLIAGQPCSDSQACASGACVDGVCCDTACAGPCVACSTALTGLMEGTCGPVYAGTDPHSDCMDEGAASCGRNGLCNGQTACALYAMGIECAPQTCTGLTKTLAKICDGTGTCQDGGTQACMLPCMGVVCGEDCVNDASCPGGQYCDIATGDCTNKRPLGATCQPNKPNECQSGFCADGVCCSSACSGTCQTCSPNGTCTQAPNGADPDGDCMDQGPASCAYDGACNGAGTCRYYAAGTVCAAGTCVGGIQTNPDTCNGAGVCVDNGSIDCSPYPCAGPVCDGVCTTDMQCGNGNYCNAGSCAPQKGTGSACSGNQECLSGSCVDGVCCNSTCTGLCEACSAAKKGSGPDGVCGPIDSGADPDNECTDDGAPSCGNDGSCDGAGGCRLYTSGVTCGPQSCVGSTQNNADVCNGMGQCTDGGTVNCAPYLCDPIVCKTSCANDGDCVAGYGCILGGCGMKLPNGDPCNDPAECQSGFCTEGVCCDGPCGGMCESCLSQFTGQSEGTCAYIQCFDPYGHCGGGQVCFDGQCWTFCP